MKVEKRTLLTGGTGLVGRRLRSTLVAKGHWVSIATRTPEATRATMAGVDYVPWLPDLAKYDAVVHLAGAGVFDQRWSDEYKREIRESRVQGTRKVVEALAAASRKPSVLVSSSAIGFYGDQGERLLPETGKQGDDFLSEVCGAWEREALKARELGVRVVLLRTGVVLARDGGALKQMLPPFKLGLGGPIGSGRAWMSWIHIDDLCGLIAHAVDNPFLDGPVNGVAPGACTNKDFTAALGRALSRPAFLPLPPFALKLMFGGVSEVLLASQRCVPQRAEATGFHFQFPTIEPALVNLVR